MLPLECPQAFHGERGEIPWNAHPGPWNAPQAFHGKRGEFLSHSLPVSKFIN
jgi:hypothetical protein